MTTSVTYFVFVISLPLESWTHMTKGPSVRGKVIQIYYVVDRGQSIFLDEMENCESNLWFKEGKLKALLTKRVFANSSSSGIYFCLRNDSSALHYRHNVIVIEKSPEVTVENPPLIEKKKHEVTCSADASFKNYNYYISLNLVFGDTYLYSRMIGSMKYKITSMDFSSFVDIDTSLEFMNGSIVCVWLFADKTEPTLYWRTLTNKTIFSEIMVPIKNVKPDQTTTSPIRTVTCSGVSSPPVFRCHWISLNKSIHFVTDEIGCKLKLTSLGRHPFTCIAYNVIAGKVYDDSWNGDIVVFSEYFYVHKAIKKKAKEVGLVRHYSNFVIKSSDSTRGGNMEHLITILVMTRIIATTEILFKLVTTATLYLTKKHPMYMSPVYNQ